jgi:DinB family protein/pentapeptide repeat protein
MGKAFEHRDLSGAVFRDANLHRALFENVNLGEATIRNANLGDVSIVDANIEGLTILGIRVDQLIEAELDRRDPERVQLRITDPHDLEAVRAVMKRLDDVHGRFSKALRAANADSLITRPSADKWSALEHVRHLVFAKDLYLNRWILRNDVPWNGIGLLPAFLAGDPDYADVGSQPTDDLESVLAAWEGINTRVRAFVTGLTPDELRRDTSDIDFGQGTIGGVLQGMARHDLHHIRRAEALIEV